MNLKEIKITIAALLIIIPVGLFFINHINDVKAKNADCVSLESENELWDRQLTGECTKK